MNEMTAYVRRADAAKRVACRAGWARKMPLSTELAAGGAGDCSPTRMPGFPNPRCRSRAAAGGAAGAGRASRAPDELLVETLRAREGQHLFVLSLRRAATSHERTAPLCSHSALARDRPGSFSMAVNDYGFELRGQARRRSTGPALPRLLSIRRARRRTSCWRASTLAELARRQFREVARVAGLVFQGYPGQQKSMRQLQASSELLFDVFMKYDPANLLVRQAKLEVLEQELEALAAARGAGADARFDAAAARDCAPDAAGVPAHGGAHPRDVLQRKGRRPRGTDARRARSRGGRDGRSAGPAGAQEAPLTVIEIDIAGEAIALLPERALLWPRERTLFVADAHFGKDAAFRAGGLPVPEGTNGETLAVLDALIARHGIARIVFLGDFLHARTARTPATLSALADWRARHAALDLALVRGNHDLHAGDPPEELGIDVVAEPHSVRPVRRLPRTRRRARRLCPGRPPASGLRHPRPRAPIGAPAMLRPRSESVAYCLHSAGSPARCRSPPVRGIEFS